MRYVDPWIIVDESTGKLVGVVDYSWCDILPVYIDDNDLDEPSIGTTVNYEKSFSLYTPEKPTYEDVKKFIMRSRYDWFTYLQKLALAQMPHMKKLITEFIKEEDRYIQDMVEYRRKFQVESRDRVFVDICLEQSVERKNRYKKILSLLSIPDSKKSNFINKDDIERAKQIPIDTFIEFKSNKACCIFHQEKSPSLHYFKKDNIAHCFGCGMHADTIQVASQIWGTGFIDTVKKLINKQ